MTQAKLAENIGVARNVVSQWEAGKMEPDEGQLTAVAEALGVPAHTLVVRSTIRDKITAAASKLFDEHGFDGATIEEICAAAQVSLAEFGTLFGSKDELLFEVLKAYNDRTFDDVQRLPPMNGSIDARLKHLLHTYYVNDLQHLRLTSALLAYSWKWGPAQERENARQISDHHKAVILLLEQAADAGEIERENFSAASLILLATYTFSLRKAVFESYDAEKLIAFIEPQIMLLLKGLGFDHRKR